MDRKGQPLSREGRKLTEKITIYAAPELKAIASRNADHADLSLSEYLVKVLADALDRPDLGVVPRKRMGRPRKPIAV